MSGSGDLCAWSVEWSQPSDRPDYPYRINKSAIVIADSASRAIEMVQASSRVGVTPADEIAAATDNARAALADLQAALAEVPK